MCLQHTKEWPWPVPMRLVPHDRIRDSSAGVPAYDERYDTSKMCILTPTDPEMNSTMHVTDYTKVCMLCE